MSEQSHSCCPAAGPFQVSPDPVSQWLDWEAQANLVGFRLSTGPVDVEVAWVPRAEVEVYVLPGASAALVARFLRAEGVCFPRHPLNTDTGVAWSDAPARERWSARFTSSRTLAMPGPDSGAELFSLKLATDHPHPNFRQPEKTKLREEALDAIAWARAIARIDRLLPPLEDVALAQEVLVVLVRGGESGFLVRDLRLFQDGHYYLPALSLPFVGRQIARAHGEELGRFWGRAYAAGVGRAKARLFARYGLWYETPNPQNLLVQLGRDLRPTGTIVFRDVGDGNCASDAFTAESVPWTRLVSDCRPETRNSFWAFDEAGEHAIDAATLAEWYARHDAAYSAELGHWFPELSPPAGLPAGLTSSTGTVHCAATAPRPPSRAYSRGAEQAPASFAQRAEGERRPARGARSPQGREAAAQRGAAERSVGPREGLKASEGGPPPG